MEGGGVNLLNIATANVELFKPTTNKELFSILRKIFPCFRPEPPVNRKHGNFFRGIQNTKTNVEVFSILRKNFPCFRPEPPVNRKHGSFFRGIKK